MTRLLLWEIAIKISLGRADFAVQPRDIAEAALATGFVELRIDWQSTARVGELPMHHRDPFDRLLIAQAISEATPFSTVDKRLARYSDLVRVV